MGRRARLLPRDRRLELPCCASWRKCESTRPKLLRLFLSGHRAPQPRPRDTSLAEWISPLAAFLKQSRSEHFKRAAHRVLQLSTKLRTQLPFSLVTRME